MTPFLLLCLAARAATARDPFGLGRTPYQPVCAHACRAAIVDSVYLDCSIESKPGPSYTTARCYADNVVFLQSLALCLYTTCGEGVAVNDTLVKYWNRYAVGFATRQPLPHWKYFEALEHAGSPTAIITPSSLLDQAKYINPVIYEAKVEMLDSWNRAEDHHGRFALILLICGFGIPVLTSLLRFLPLPCSFVSKLEATLVNPSAWGWTWLLVMRDRSAISPTRGQVLFGLYLLVLNVTLAGVGHFALIENDWAPNDRRNRFSTCLSNRLGALSIANLPLVILYAGRNNLLMWVTGWSHPTFLILHRWVGYICVFEVVIHSLIYLFVAISEHKHTTWSTLPAWIAGATATVFLSTILPLTAGWLRRKAYELFLVGHILLSAAALVGAYFHIFLLSEDRYSGFTLFIWISSMLWLGDRLARFARLARTGIRKARISTIDNDYIRIDVPCATANGHAYLYFPTLTWRIWENHPFSAVTISPPMIRASFAYSSDVAPRSPGTPGSFSSVQSSFNHARHDRLWQKSPLSPTSQRMPPTPSSTTRLLFSEKISQDVPDLEGSEVTFFMRTQDGMTALLRTRREVPVLMEGSYGKLKNLDKFPIRLVFAGGVGITACLPYLQMHTNGCSVANLTKLYWGCRSMGLVEALHDEVRFFEGAIAVGKRLDMTAALHNELSGLGEDASVAVIVSGPKTMADELRLAVCKAARNRKGPVKFIDECFGW